MKAHVLGIPKMWYFLGLAVFKVGLLAAEVGSKFKKKIDGKAVSFFRTPLIFGDGGKISKSVDFEQQ